RCRLCYGSNKQNRSQGGGPWGNQGFPHVREAVRRAGAGNTAVLVNTSPLFVALAGVLFLRQRLSFAAVAGLLVGFGGVVAMTAPQLGGGSGTGNLALGMGLALILSVGWAL